MFKEINKKLYNDKIKLYQMILKLQEFEVEEKEIWFLVKVYRAENIRVFCSKPKKNVEAKKNGIGRDNPITHDILDSFGKTLTGTGLSSPRAEL